MKLSNLEKEIESLTNEEIKSIFPWRKERKYISISCRVFEHRFGRYCIYRWSGDMMGVLNEEEVGIVKNYTNNRLLIKKREQSINEIIK